jgi:hypothetical protein
MIVQVLLISTDTSFSEQDSIPLPIMENPIYIHVEQMPRTGEGVRVGLNFGYVDEITWEPQEIDGSGVISLRPVLTVRVT